MYEEDLNTLEDLLRRLKVEYDIFFNGNRKRPPDELRGRLEKLVKRLSLEAGMSFAERFQFNTLVARFYLYRDVWRRALMKQESGIEKEIQRPAGKEDLPASPQQLPEYRIRLEDPAAEPEKIRELYEALVRLGGARAKAAPKISYGQFATYVTAQTQSIKQKLGCSSVVFTLVIEEDSIKFRAAAADSPQPGGAQPRK